MCANDSLFSCVFTATSPTTGTASVCQARRRACGTGELKDTSTRRNMLEHSSTLTEPGKIKRMRPTNANNGAVHQSGDSVWHQEGSLEVPSQSDKHNTLLSPTTSPSLPVCWVFVYSVYHSLMCVHSWNLGPVHIISLSTEVYFYLVFGLELLFKQYEWLRKDLEVNDTVDHGLFYSPRLIFPHPPSFSFIFSFVTQ